MVLVFLIAASAFGQPPQDRVTPQGRVTMVEPLPDEEILRACEYRLAPLGPTDPVRAAWVIFDRGQDYLRWFQDPRIRAFARTHKLALVLAMQCRSKEREDMIVLPEKGVGRAMFTALEQFAISEQRLELQTAPVIAMGWSGAGELVARLAGYRPERYLASIGYAPGQYEPLGMDTIQLSREAIGKPQLIIANGGDNINGTERPYGYFRKYFEQGAPWTFVVQNRTPHCCLQNAETLILDWLDAVLSAHRASQSYGYLKVQMPATVDEWKKPVFNATAARVGQRGKPRSGELPGGWLPSAVFADEWRTFVTRPEPVAIWKP